LKEPVELLVDAVIADKGDRISSALEPVASYTSIGIILGMKLEPLPLVIFAVNQVMCHAVTKVNYTKLLEVRVLALMIHKKLCINNHHANNCHNNPKPWVFCDPELFQPE
jgi:hypothetical protein